jgi:hypothetical protein
MTECCGRNKRGHLRAPARAIVTLCLGASSLTGCMSLANEEGRLPDAMRGAIATLSAKGYPDLTKIPDTPTDLPSQLNWSSLESRLVSQGAALAANPTAALPTSEETNVSWAASARNELERDPRAESLPAGAPSTPEWATAARAKLNADLARLPPP